MKSRTSHRVNLLILNAGSSSIKLTLYQENSFPLTIPAQAVWSKEIEIPDGSGLTERRHLLINEVSQLWSAQDSFLQSPSEVAAVGHRVVHGGPIYMQSVVISDEVKTNIAKYAKFAPLQNPFNLLGIEAMQSLFGSAPQVAVFDTAFHATLPVVAREYAVPRAWEQAYGIRKFGYHGISHWYVSHRAAAELGIDLGSIRIVTCHLGGGCSLAAIREGNSIDTTMGFSTLEGLMMGTRCGSIDPAIPLSLIAEGILTRQEVEDALYHSSGLLGVSGISSDMRKVMAAASIGHADARLAFDMFIDRLAKGIATMAVALRGIDCIVFTGGIGQNSAEVRAAACAQLEFLGIRLDQSSNEEHGGDRVISKTSSTVHVLSIESHEDWAIAHDCWRLVGQG